MKENINNTEETAIKPKTKFFTKDKVCVFIIGLLLGAVIASAAFLIYTNVTGGNQSHGMPSGTPPEMSEDGTPPELPNGETPPEMPDGEMPEGEMPEGEAPSDTSDDSSNSSTDNSDSSNSNRTRPEKSKTKSTDAN